MSECAGWRSFDRTSGGFYGAERMRGPSSSQAACGRSTDFDYELQMAQTNRIRSVLEVDTAVPDVQSGICISELHHGQRGGILTAATFPPFVPKPLCGRENPGAHEGALRNLNWKWRGAVYMSSRMEQIIEEIEEYIDSCKFQPLSSTKIISQ